MRIFNNSFEWSRIVLTVRGWYLQWLPVMLLSSRAVSPRFWCTAALSSPRHAALIFSACVRPPSLLPLPLSLSRYMLPPFRNLLTFFPLYPKNCLVSFFVIVEILHITINIYNMYFIGDPSIKTL